MASPPPPDPLLSSSLTHYEKQRLENVKRNQAMLAALGVNNAASDLRQRTRAETKKGYSPKVEKRPKLEEPVVIRRSLRSQGLPPDGGELQEILKPATPIAQKQNPKKRSKKGCRRSAAAKLSFKTAATSASREPLSLDSVYRPVRRGASAERFLENLRSLADETPFADLRGSMKPLKGSNEVEPSSLSLNSEDIARIARDRILSVGFLPMRDKLVAFAGSIAGHLSFWDVDCNERSEGDGVHIYRPHQFPVSGIAVAPFSTTKIFTCSYDGTVRRMDIESSKFEVLYSTDVLLCDIQFVPGNAHCAFLSEGQGRLKMLDTREGKSRGSGFELHNFRINTIDFNSQTTSMIATSGSDATACVWDIRKLKNADSSIMKVEHCRAVHSAYFSPSGSTLATCSYDSNIGLLRGFQQGRNGVPGFTEQNPTMIQHDNRTGRWISTFRAIWGWDDEHIYVGNMDRGIDVISTSSNARKYTLNSPLMTSIPCRLAVHPLCPGILAGSTAGGQLYVWRL